MSCAKFQTSLAESVPAGESGRQGLARPDKAWQGWQGLARPGKAWQQVCGRLKNLSVGSIKGQVAKYFDKDARAKAAERRLCANLRDIALPHTTSIGLRARDACEAPSMFQAHRLGRHFLLRARRRVTRPAAARGKPALRCNFGRKTLCNVLGFAEEAQGNSGRTFRTQGGSWLHMANLGYSVRTAVLCGGHTAIPAVKSALLMVTKVPVRLCQGHEPIGR